MEKIVDSIVFRRLTYADFRHINKEGGEEEGGGGQSYIDFPITDVSLEDWFNFLGDNTGVGAGERPQWRFQINSVGLKEQRELKIYQRRPASVCIASQKIHSEASNRVPAWHPDNTFPLDYVPGANHLVVYIVKTTDGQFWAGWFLENDVPKNWQTNEELRRLFTEEAGHIQLKSNIFVDTENKDWAFYFIKETSPQAGEEFEIDEHLADEDTSIKLKEIEKSDLRPEVKERLIKIRKRNYQIVKNLKKLYKGHCQISGDTLTFRKKDGELYSEVHHLIPLGEDGSDSYANVVAISPLVHRMLHYANVSKIDLSEIKDNKVEIIINEIKWEITWHPEHSKIVEESLED